MTPLKSVLKHIALLSLGVAAVAHAQPADRGAAPIVVLQTSQGDIVLQLDREHAPLSVTNFLRYTCEGHYDGTVFHRVIPGFMIQGGGYDASLNDRPRHAPIKLESGNGLSNLRGTVAMARLHAPDTADSEFFINLVDNPKLDLSPSRGPGYAVFGRVVTGMETVDRIAALPTAEVNEDFADVPVDTVLIRKASSQSCHE
jgi:cyclophilin family peptidyl-prolyl cis-trans isomerase